MISVLPLSVFVPASARQHFALTFGKRVRKTQKLEWIEDEDRGRMQCKARAGAPPRIESHCAAPDAREEGRYHRTIYI